MMTIDEYIAIIEAPEGYTYEQPYYDFYELLELVGHLGDDYRVVAIY